MVKEVIFHPKPASVPSNIYNHTWALVGICPNPDCKHDKAEHRLAAQKDKYLCWHKLEENISSSTIFCPCAVSKLDAIEADGATEPLGELNSDTPDEYAIYKALAPPPAQTSTQNASNSVFHKLTTWQQLQLIYAVDARAEHLHELYKDCVEDYPTPSKELLEALAEIEEQENLGSWDLESSAKLMEELSELLTMGEDVIIWPYIQGHE